MGHLHVCGTRTDVRLGRTGEGPGRVREAGSGAAGTREGRQVCPRCGALGTEEGGQEVAVPFPSPCRGVWEAAGAGSPPRCQGHRGMRGDLPGVVAFIRVPTGLWFGFQALKRCHRDVGFWDLPPSRRVSPVHIWRGLQLPAFLQRSRSWADVCSHCFRSQAPG